MLSASTNMMARAMIAAACSLVLMLACADPSPPEADAATMPDDAASTPADASPPPPDGGYEQVLELGAGIGDAMNSPDDSDVELWAGPQGGFHIYVSLRARWLMREPGSEPATIELSVADASGRELTRLSFRHTLPPQADGWAPLTGLLLELFPITSLDELLGETVSVSATLDDPSGVSLTCDRVWNVVSAPSRP